MAHCIWCRVAKTSQGASYRTIAGAFCVLVHEDKLLIPVLEARADPLGLDDLEGQGLGSRGPAFQQFVGAASAT